MKASVCQRMIVIACAVMLTSSACGDDDDSDSSVPDHTGMDGGPVSGSAASGSGGGGGTSTAPMTEPITPLPDNIAGKACMSAADCGSGTCASQVTGAAFSPVATPGGYCTNVCDSDVDCGSGGACVGALAGILQGQCFAACAQDSDCREQYLCVAGLMILGVTAPSTCLPVPATDQLDDEVAGAVCETGADCGDGTCLTMRVGAFGQPGATLPGGYCTGDCLQDSECGGGGVCLSSGAQGVAGSCYRACANDADCGREGYRCRTLAEDVHGCDVAPDPLADDTAGAACESDDDCGGTQGACRSTVPGSGLGAGGVAAPNGYCTQACTEDSDCGAGGVCVVSGGFGGLGGSGLCYRPCESAGDCRGGYMCEERGGAGGGLLPVDAGTIMPTLVCTPAPAPLDEDDGGL